MQRAAVVPRRDFALCLPCSLQRRLRGESYESVQQRI